MEAEVGAEDIFLWDSKEPKVVLRFTREEWGAFILGAKAGEFDLPEQVTEASLLEHES